MISCTYGDDGPGGPIFAWHNRRNPYITIDNRLLLTLGAHFRRRVPVRFLSS